MRILAVDTTTSSGSVAVLHADREDSSLAVLAVVGTRSDEAYSSRLFRQLEFLLAELRLATGDFDLFAVASGPGSFTGLRVGLTAVKGWAEVHHRPIAAVSALEAIAHSARNVTDGPGEIGHSRIVAIADARRGHVYGGIYERNDSGLRPMADDVVMSAAEFWAHLKENGVAGDAAFATTAPRLVQKFAEGSPFSDCRIIDVSSVLAPAVGEVGWGKLQRGETCDALTLDAHYVRRSDAEVLFKG